MRNRIPFLKGLRIATTLIAIVIMIFTMTSSTRVPIHQRVLIQGIGIDRSETGRFHVTVQAVSTSSSSSIEVYEADGTSVFDALNNITVVSGKTPFYTHNSVIILGSDCAKQGLESVMDFFVRHHQTRPAESVFLAKGNAKDILTLQTNPEFSMENDQLQMNQYVMTDQIEQLASAGNLNSQLLEIRVLDVANALYSQSNDVYLPTLTVQEQQIAMDGCGIFKGDSLQAMLDSDTTVGIKAINNQLTGGAVTVKLEDGNQATLSVLDSSCSVTAELQNQRPHFTVSLTCELNINETTQPLRKILSVQEFTPLQDRVSEQIQQAVEHALTMTLHKNQVDVVNFSDVLRKQQTDWWKQNESKWHDLLSQCTFSVEMKSKITAEGQEMSPQTITPSPVL